MSGATAAPPAPPPAPAVPRSLRLIQQLCGPEFGAIRARETQPALPGDPKGPCPSQGARSPAGDTSTAVPQCLGLPSCGLGPPRTSRPGAAPTGAGCKNGIKTRLNPRVWHRGGRSQAGTAASATPSLLAPQGDSQNWGFGPSCHTRGSPTHG